MAVPTPIDGHRNPDLSPLCGASEIVGRQMPRGACVVFESTVFPGATEDVCVPILEQESGLSLGVDSTVGDSPERINLGDKVQKRTKTMSDSFVARAFSKGQSLVAVG